MYMCVSADPGESQRRRWIWGLSPGPLQEQYSLLTTEVTPPYFPLCPDPILPSKVMEEMPKQTLLLLRENSTLWLIAPEGFRTW